MDIIGVHEIGYGTNAGMFLGKPVSWVRDEPGQYIESNWQATYRDVVILGPQNGKLGVFNLTTYDLRLEVNRTALKDLLVAAATPEDTDHDGIPDYWEQQHFGSLAGDGNSPGTGGIKTLLHYALANRKPEQMLPEGLPMITPRPDGGISVFFQRRRGTAFGLTVVPEFSNALDAWTGVPSGWEQVGVRTLYDGSGGEAVEWRLPAPGGPRQVRLKVDLPAP
ncbi:MAG: hypothetical protein KA004_07850 [Verrucomicrobiales bacterium]|nr:hypothetical protein [Verrucomicrobiales bacterium]